LDDDAFTYYLQDVLSGLSFQGSVDYSGGCQSDSGAGSFYSNVGDALAGGICYVQVESSGRRLAEDSVYPEDNYYSNYAPPPSSTPNPVCGCEEMGASFCIYDYGASGFCESCGDVSSSPCDQRGLPDAGVADCEACCNASHSYPLPHPRPNRSGA
jgi:hypothetical protein